MGKTKQVKNVEREEREIIDSHSHIGYDRFMSHRADLGEYAEMATRKGISGAIMIPQVCPCYSDGDGRSFLPSFWEKDGDRVRVYSGYEVDEEIVDRGPVRENPFAEYNGLMKKEIDDMGISGRFSDLKLYFAPLVHPIKDTAGQLEKILESNPTAVKVHGTSWMFNPKEIDPEFFRKLARSDTPLIIHTDYHQNPQNEFEYNQRNQDPLVWAKLCEKYGVRASLAHGARLCKETWDIVRNSDQFVVGAGPVLNMKGPRVKGSGGEYLPTLAGMADPRKLTYDIDYPANTRLEEPGELDWNFDKELLKYFSKEELQDVYSGNAKRFFQLD
jgi:hypothetical protein